jgi:hypothetical protein
LSIRMGEGIVCLCLLSYYHKFCLTFGKWGSREKRTEREVGVYLEWQKESIVA